MALPFNIFAEQVDQQIDVLKMFIQRFFVFDTQAIISGKNYVAFSHKNINNTFEETVVLDADGHEWRRYTKSRHATFLNIWYIPKNFTITLTYDCTDRSFSGVKNRTFQFYV